jgi:hypothetical protein
MVIAGETYVFASKTTLNLIANNTGHLQYLPLQMPCLIDIK